MTRKLGVMKTTKEEIGGAEAVVTKVVKSRNRSACVKWYPLPVLAFWMQMSEGQGGLFLTKRGKNR